MTDIRLTVVDQFDTVSFVGPGHLLKVLAAACSRGATDHRALLALASEYDAAHMDVVLAGLHIFDEHNTDQNTLAFRALTPTSKEHEAPPFRVVDETTRLWSLRPSRSGLVVFNLRDRRIVQIQNSYSELGREGRGRIRSEGRPTPRLFYYRLPGSWRLVP